MKLLFKLADNMFFLIGSIITLLIAIIGGVIAFHFYPITTALILSLWLLVLLFAIISDTPKKAA
ncbi:hypothetical protein [Pasteurella multocida]|uniref:hypothetical protein n=1 Tax=Pasteurella multocida TaxID=747 RepID=UPI0009F6569A|nr:hypothetical protein [Pasteurella multocida]PNM02563.1 hypothetical protein A6J89_001695 [Pasteurella multocida]URJ96618.1 hypothetical protein M9413_07365 [Pasteurella multocida]HDR1428752.1 hypothetical protein [Pasteurella multocida]HDV7289190.1 hypothetical protein [Pasteurella multocida]